MFRKTKSGVDGKEGVWRRCRADGELYRATSEQKPVEIIQSIWHNARNVKEVQKQIALLKMEKKTKANPTLLAEAKKPENAAEIEKELLAIKRRKKESKKKAGGEIKGRKSVMETRLRNLEQIIEQRKNRRYRR